MTIPLALLEEDRIRIEQLTVGWDDPTQVNWDEGEAAAGAEAVVVPAAPLYKCTALYSYTVSLPPTNFKTNFIVYVSNYCTSDRSCG